MRWVRLYCEDWLSSSIRLENTEVERGFFTTLLALAGRSGYDGVIAASQSSEGGFEGYPVSHLAWLTKLPIEETRRIIELFRKQERISVVEGSNSLGEPTVVLRITSWKLYQSEYARQRPYRTGELPEKPVTEPKPVPEVGELPAWVPAEPWREFMEVRKKLRAPATDGAIKRLWTKLGKLKAEGHDPAQVLGQSIERGWRGLFPLAVEGENRGRRTMESYDERIARENSEVVARYLGRDRGAVAPPVGKKTGGRSD